MKAKLMLQKGEVGLLRVNGTNEHRCQLETHHALVGGLGTLLRFSKISKLSPAVTSGSA